MRHAVVVPGDCSAISGPCELHDDIDPDSTCSAADCACATTAEAHFTHGSCNADADVHDDDVAVPKFGHAHVQLGRCAG